ncbi:chitin deacetylase [Dissophora globulifera]|uniref:Chitin deacetylase n=1 Tax=Dissophora globulifera TaxID=979702 RepID=A0A9P6V085_9FUNG|nr:chitin deacetylase [Dissophora globulifera]
MRFLHSTLALSALVAPWIVSAAAPEEATPSPAVAPAAPTTAPATAPSTATGPVTWADFVTSCQTPGQIALTYSEGPSEATMAMLETLREADAKVTFFANATWLQYMQYAGVARHAHMDGHLIGMTYRLPSDTSTGHTDDDLKNDIARHSRTIQDLIGVYPKYMKVHESNLKDVRLLNLVQSMGYTLVGFNLDEYDYKYNTAATAPQIADVYNAIFSKQMDAFGRRASYVVAGYDVPSTGAAAGLPKVINTIQTSGYDMVRLDGCANDKTPYKKDPILNNGYVGDAKSFGGADYKHGQKAVTYNPNAGGKGVGSSPAGGNGGTAPGEGKSSQDGGSLKKSAAPRTMAAVSTLLVLPALVCAYLL